MHQLPSARAAEVRQSSAGDEATRGFIWMINGRKQSPLGAAFIERVVVKRFVPCSLAHQIAELYTCTHCKERQFLNRGAGIQQAKAWFLDQRHAAYMASLDLD